MEVYIDSNESDWRKKALRDIIDSINAETTFEGAGEKYVPIVKSLEFADFAAGDLGIEFKEPGDFISSVFDKRLFDQAMGLRMNFANPRIVINCAYSDLFQAEIIRGFHPNAVAALIPTLIFHYKVNVDFTGARGRDNFIKYMRGYLGKALDGKTIIPHLPVRPSSTPKDHMRAMLTCFPGIGDKKAEVIMSKYKSLKDFIDNPKRLLTVRGFGPVTVKKIQAVIDSAENDGWSASPDPDVPLPPPIPKGIPITKMTEEFDPEAETRMTAKWGTPVTKDNAMKEMSKY